MHCSLLFKKKFTISCTERFEEKNIKSIHNPLYPYLFSLRCLKMNTYFFKLASSNKLVKVHQMCHLSLSAFHCCSTIKIIIEFNLKYGELPTRCLYKVLNYSFVLQQLFIMILRVNRVTKKK